MIAAIRQSHFDQSDLENIRNKRLRLVPLLDENKEIIKLYNFREMKSILPLDAIIMAGGEGLRMRPLSHAGGGFAGVMGKCPIFVGFGGLGQSRRLVQS